MAITPLHEWCWDADILLAVLSLTRDRIKDQSYWYDTIDRVEEGNSPDKNQRITLSELSAWVERCTTEPTATEETESAQRKTRSVSPANRYVPNT